MGWGVGSFLVQPQSRQEFHRLEYLPSVYYSDQIWPIFIFNPKPSNGLVPLNSTLKHWHFIFLWGGGKVLLSSFLFGTSTDE